MTAAPAKFPIDPKNLHIHSLTTMSVMETKHLEDLCNEKLRDSGSNARCIVHAWTAPLAANRRDTWRLCQRFFHANRCSPSVYSSFLFVGWLGWQKDTEIGVLQCSHDFPHSTRRMLIEKVVKCRQAFYNPPYSGSDRCGLYDDPAFELILDPYARFFYDPPPFLISNVVEVPVFFLTKHVTEEENKFISTGLCGPGKHDAGLDYPEIVFVKWRLNKDGSEEDIWRLLWHCSSYRGVGRIDTAMFVDKQTASDNQIIMADLM